MSHNWILLADSARARLLFCDDRFEGMTEFADFVHPASRLKDRDLTSDAPGRRRGAQSTHGVEERGDREPRVFARELAQRLLRGLDDHAWERLVVAASPPFLGELRGAFPPRVSERVSVEIPRDLVSVPLHELPERLQALTTL